MRGVLSDHRTHTGDIDLSELARRWRLLDALYATAEKVIAGRDTQILCARTVDEGQVAGHRVYRAAESHLNIARDNHHALKALISGSHGLTTFAPWNLLRPEFEAAFYAAWVLDPDDSLERRRRALRLELIDQRDHELYVAEVMAMAGSPATEHLSDDFHEYRVSDEEVRERNGAVYRAEAEQLGLPYPRVQSVQVRDELGRLSTCRMAPHVDVWLRSTWRGLSGIQHGRTSAVLRSTNLRDRQDTAHGVRGLLDVNDDAFLNAAHAATSLHIEAVRLLIARTQP